MWFTEHKQDSFNIAYSDTASEIRQLLHGVKGDGAEFLRRFVALPKSEGFNYAGHFAGRHGFEARHKESVERFRKELSEIPPTRFVQYVCVEDRVR